MRNKDLYIRALEYADKKNEFTLNQLKKDLKLEETEAKKLSCQIGLNKLFQRKEASNIPLQLFINSNKYWDIKLYMTIEDKFRLLEYIELKEARKSSKTATYFATAALATSCISIIISIIQTCSRN